MSQYATLADLGNAIFPGALDSLPPAQHVAALVTASATADSYIQAQYALPMVRWGADLRTAVCTLAIYELMSARGYSSEGDNEEIRRRALDAREWLKDVGRGVAALADAVDSTPTVRDAGVMISTLPSRGW